MNAITTFLDSLEAAEPVHAGGLTMVPLLARAEIEPAYLTLDQGLAGGTVRVQEVSEQGSVPELLFLNEGGRCVLVLDGEELIGAKQNRIANLTVLVPPRSRLTLPVSCVEAGRWHRRSREFTTARRAYYSSGRALKSRSVSAAYREFRQPRSDQGAIWDDIAHKSARLASQSPTSAMDAMYERVAPQLERLEVNLPSRPRQVGGLFLAGPVALGVDVFDSAVTWRLLAPKLVASYGLDAYDGARLAGVRRAGDTSWPAVRDRVRKLHQETYPAVGMGSDVRLEGPELHGAALIVDERVVHLALFHEGAAA